MFHLIFNINFNWVSLKQIKYIEYFAIFINFKLILFQLNDILNFYY